MTMSKREMLREKRRKAQQRNRTMMIVVVVVAALALTGILVIPNIVANMQPVGSITQITPNPRPNANGLSMGDPNAPIKVVEYADFQCPFCRQFTENYEQGIIDKYVKTGQVYYTFVTDSFIGPESKAAAQAAYCANDQGKFWEYHDMLFANQTSENSGDFSAKRLKAFADSLGLNASDFASCLDSGKYASQVNQDLVKADQAGVTSTPSFTLDGKLITFNQMTDLDTAIAAALGK